MVQGTPTVVTQVGSVVLGKYAGSSANRTASFVTADLSSGCLSSEGLARVRGQETLTLTRP
ncbi:hypothetical protein LXT21_31265 [Myxococcus sp. K38C18041901]|uniref:hypothetical protein n=1 Tax=Myxococcus guangdongensis TaxID=2906760 RepID=UPI0020A727C9|nr:hypothetical protein [Myxococcus guangdongensis]MCP3063267.1 hypothetical protein [Myxococcus guangdongensis]